ncbi:MAG: GTP-binding protein [Patescibacteria group bacterium]|nr:GTP-binding protein [Patescibacteria group bacterium]
MPTPITVFTGYLGSGKTTVILNLIKQLPKEYKSVWLKNEFGDAAVDSQLAKESNIAVQEILNGCLCCVLVGKLGEALEEIIRQYAPDRIIVETSGSAYPAPIAVEIHRHPETLKLDGVVTVIDALNFTGYRDKSFTAQHQAKYTDLILINKHELVDERRLDDVLDDVYELNLETPKVKTDHGVVDPALIFGLDTRLFETAATIALAEAERDERHHERDVEILQIRSDRVFDDAILDIMLKNLPPENFYRIKGLVRRPDGWFALNYVFGRWDWTPLAKYDGPTRVTFMGKNLADWRARIGFGFGIPTADVA